LESQRVKCLTEGYLRGWLKFEYTTKTSIFREELILDYIIDERVYALLQNKLSIETILRSSAARRDNSTLAPIFDVADDMIRLKLPKVLPPKDKKDKAKAKSKELTQEELAEWKNFLAQVNKK
jgi:hypothetical protein